MTETTTAPSTVVERPLPVFDPDMLEDQYTDVQNYLDGLCDKVLYDSARPNLRSMPGRLVRKDDPVSFEILECHWEWFLDMRDSIRQTLAGAGVNDDELASTHIRNTALSELSKTWKRHSRMYANTLVPGDNPDYAGVWREGEPYVTAVLKQLAAMQYLDELPDGAFSLEFLKRSEAFEDDADDELTIALDELVKKGWLLDVDGWWEIPHKPDLSAQLRMHRI